jgi:hypothetical protein
MRAVTIAVRWILHRLAWEPLAWLCGGLLLAAGPALEFGAGGLRQGEVGGGGPALELVFVGALVGVGLAGAGLEGLRALLARARDSDQRLAEAMALLIGACLGCLPGLIWASIHVENGEGGLRISHFIATGLAAGHAAGLGFLLARLPLGSTGRSVALPLLAWALPALLPPAPRAAEVASWLLDLSRPLRALPEDATGVPSPAGLLPMIILWAGGAWLGAGAARPS